MSLNVVHLVGRAGANPEIKYFESGTMLCTLPLAVDRRSRNDEKPDWFNLKIWGKTAKVAGDFVHKGKQIAIEGSLTIETWDDASTGAKRSKPVILVNRLQLLGSKRDSDGGGDSGSYSSDDDEF